MARQATTDDKIKRIKAPTTPASMVSSLMRMESVGTEQMVRLNDEMLRFAVQRLENDREFLNEVTVPNDPLSAASIWQGYLASAANEFVDEGRKLWTLYMTEVTDTMMSAQDRMQSALVGGLGSVGGAGQNHSKISED